MNEHQISVNGTIVFFGEKSVLSNLYPLSFSVDGKEYETVSQYYQSAKKAKMFDLHQGLDVMMSGLICKFENVYCRYMLLETGSNHLVEATCIENGSRSDRYWGSYSSILDDCTFNRTYQGENNLGKLLEKVRDILNEPIVRNYDF